MIHKLTKIQIMTEVVVGCLMAVAGLALLPVGRGWALAGILVTIAGARLVEHGLETEQKRDRAAARRS